MIWISSMSCLFAGSIFTFPTRLFWKTLHTNAFCCAVQSRISDDKQVFCTFSFGCFCFSSLIHTHCLCEFFLLTPEHDTSLLCRVVLVRSGCINNNTTSPLGSSRLEMSCQRWIEHGLLLLKVEQIYFPTLLLFFVLNASVLIRSFTRFIT